MNTSDASSHDNPDDLNLRVERSLDDAGDEVLHVSGEVDLATIPIVRAAAEELLRDRPGAIQFDLSGVEFMDSSGLVLLLEMVREVPTLRIVRPSQVVRRLIAMSGLESILTMTS